MLPLCCQCTHPLDRPHTFGCGHSVCSDHLPITCPLGCTQSHHPSPNHKLDVTLNNAILSLSTADLSCEICFALLYKPVTTPCQHTFCAKCLQRSLDHSPSCPLCRHRLSTLSYFHDHPVNVALESLIIKLFPTEYSHRADQLRQQERNARLDTPIFVCQLRFPGMPTLLHFFEPRYRLMLRRCLDSPNRRFGMIMPPKTTIPPSQTEYGTMLEIRSVQVVPDGRSMVEAWGSFRFRILERDTLDGYMIGRIERIDDYPDDITEPLHPSLPLNPSNTQLIDICKEFLDRLQRGTAPWVVQRLSSTFGSMPSDPSSFSFWVALVLPIDDYEKAKLLPIRSPRLRLLLVVHWIEQLNNNWYAWLYFMLWNGSIVDGFLLPISVSFAFVLIALRLIGWI